MFDLLLVIIIGGIIGTFENNYLHTHTHTQAIHTPFAFSLIIKINNK